MKRLFPAALSLLFVFTAAAQTPDCLDRVAAYEAAPPLLAGDTLRLAGSGGGSLLYVGATHTSDPADPFFERLDEMATRFKPTLVFFEGPDRGVEAGRAETIRALGESGYARFLAAQHGARVARLEPPPQQEFAAVADTLGAERAALFFVLRETARLRDRRGLTGDTLRQAVAELIARAAPLGLPISSLETLDTLFQRLVTPTTGWEKVPGAWFDPLRFDEDAYFFPTANRASSHFRNRHMVTALAEAVTNGERVLAVVGRNHLPSQAPALRCLLAR